MPDSEYPGHGKPFEEDKVYICRLDLSRGGNGFL